MLAASTGGGRGTLPPTPLTERARHSDSSYNKTSVSSSLFVASEQSPCKSTQYNKAVVSSGDWGAFQCKNARVLSKTHIKFGDLPIGIRFRCDQSGGVHVGFDSVNQASNGTSLPFGKVQCLASNQVRIGGDTFSPRILSTQEGRRGRTHQLTGSEIKYFEKTI